MNNEIKQYKWRGKYYNSKEVEKLLYDAHHDASFGDELGQIHLNIRKVINLRVLARILKKGGMPLLARKIYLISKNSEHSVKAFFAGHNLINKINYDMYHIRMHGIRLGSVSNRLHDIGNNSCTSYVNFINELLRYTIGAENIPYDGEFIDVEKLSEKECRAIAKNFARYKRTDMIWDKDLNTVLKKLDTEKKHSK